MDKKYRFIKSPIEISTKAGPEYYSIVCQMQKTGEEFIGEEWSSTEISTTYKIHGDRWRFPKEWLVEVPAKSAFQEWNDNACGECVVGDVSVTKYLRGRYDARKEGYNFAIDAVLKLHAYKIDLVKPGQTHSAVLCNDIRELREP